MEDTYGAFDLSKGSSGWARYTTGDDAPEHGLWKNFAGPETEHDGQLPYKIFEALVMMERDKPFRKIFAEMPVNISQDFQGTSATNIKLSMAQFTAVNMFSYTYDVPVYWVHQKTWRKFSIGRIPGNTPSTDLKYLALKRCKDLGFRPEKHDDAEALLLLNYGLCAVEDLWVPWHGKPKPVAPPAPPPVQPDLLEDAADG